MISPSIAATTSSSSPSPSVLGRTACESQRLASASVSTIATSPDAEFPKGFFQNGENPETYALRRRWFHAQASERPSPAEAGDQDPNVDHILQLATNALHVNKQRQPLNSFGHTEDREEYMQRREWYLKQTRKEREDSIRYSVGSSTESPAKDQYDWRKPWSALALAAGVMILSLSVWFSSSAFLSEICGDFDLSPSQASLLTVAVNIGFTVGATSSAIAQLPDRVLTSRLLFAGSFGSAACNALFAAPGATFVSLLAARFLNGVALSFVYPVLMRHVSSWFKPAKRGLALGCVVGSLVVGIALPNLLRALFPGMPWRVVVLGSSGLALLGAVLSQGVQDGPHVQKQPAFSAEGACLVIRCRSWQIVTLSYIGHNLELFGGWAWIGVFLREFFDARGIDASLGDAAAFSVVALGVPGCIVGGLVADRFGRRVAIASSHITSGVAITVLPSVAAAGAPAWLVVLVAAVWGFAAIADSAQYSALISEVLPTKQLLGTAMALSLALGFTSTAVGIYAVPVLFEWGGWGRAFPCLALGPVVGLCAIACIRPSRPTLMPPPVPFSAVVANRFSCVTRF